MPDARGVNFSVFSRNATAVELLLFAEHDDRKPVQIVKLDPATNKTFFFWHVYVKGLRPGAHYAYRADGPADLHGQGFRYNPNKVLIDPYACGNTDALWNRADACGPNDNLATSMRSVVIDLADYDWEGDRPLNQPMNEMVIYELHVGGFTRHPSAGVRHPGTFAAVVEKIPYLKELGITAVELLPVMEFDRKEVLRTKPDGSGPLTNYWGYSTVGFFAPEPSYCVSPRGRAPTSASSATWSRPCTAQASPSSSTRSSTTPARATTSAPRSTSRASATRSPTTSCRPTGSITWTTPAAATR